MTNRTEYLISWFAIARIGAVSCPLNPSYKEREVAYQLDNSEAVSVIVQYELLPLVEAARSELPALKLVITVGSDKHTDTSHGLAFDQLILDNSPRLVKRPEIEWEDVVTLPYSSGTTGLPKGVLLSHKNLVCNALQSIATARITSQDRMLVFLPLYHIYGIMLMGCAAMSGATLVLMERFETERCLQLIQEHGVTLTLHSTTNTFCVKRLAAIERVRSPHRAFCSMWCCSSTADPGTPFSGAYTCSSCDFLWLDGRRLQERILIRSTIHSVSRSKTVGLPIHDTRQKIVDIETGQIELGIGEEGELIVQGPQVMQGYWKAQQATAETLRNGWLYTGDIGFRDAEGYVTITDRKKEMIKFKGFSVAPAQIEALLLEHPSVADVAVIAKPDTEAGEVPKAFVLLKMGSEDQSADDLLAWANSKLAGYKNVREIEFIDSIPRNPSGKILRRVLKEQERRHMGLS